MQNSVAKKIFALGVAASTLLGAAVPFATLAAPHADGTNVSDSSGTIWMIAGGQRRAYTSAGAFLSYGFNSFASVVPASAEDLALPAGSFIPPQDGSIICSDRGSDKGTCYEISNGMKYGFTSAAVFTGLGFSFANSMPGDVSWMATGSSLINNTTMAHLPGTLVNNGGTVQLVGANGLLGVPDLATFNSWGYSFGKVVPANASDKAMTQTGVFSARVAGQLSPSWTSNPNNPPVYSGSVNAMLASDNPASGTLVSSSSSSNGGQVGADIAHFTFTGSGTVTQVVINRTGVSADSSISNVYLYSGDTRITDAGTFSQGKVTFSNSNGLFNVSGSTTISVRVDVATGISGQTVGAQLASFSVANGTPASTSISGNMFTIAQVSDLATVKLSVSSGNTTIIGSGASGGTAGTINAGTSNANLWGTTVTVSQRAVKLSNIQFRQIGSISSDAVQNLRLLVDGSPVGNTASITNMGSSGNSVVFTVSPALTLNTGSHTIELHGDVVKGTSYNYNFTLQTQADALFWDTSYNVAVPLTYSAGSTILQLSPGLTTVNSGSVTVQQDSSFTATQFVSNASQVKLGQWTMKAYGEDVKVQSLQVKISYFTSAGAATTTLTTEGFNNLAVYVNDAQVGSSQSALNTGAATNVTYTFGSTNLFTIPAGTTVTVSVKGDSVSSSGIIGQVRADLINATQTLQGVTSFSLTPSSTQTYTGSTLSVSSSAATLTKNTAYSDQTTSPNQTKKKIGSFVIQASSADGVRVNSLTTTLTGSAQPTTTLANLYLVTPDMPSGTTPVAPATTNNFTVNFTVPMSGTATVDVYADVSNTSGTVVVALNGSGIGTGSSQTVTLTSATGQTVTVGSGTLSTPTLNTGASPNAQFVIGGSSNQPIGTFNFVSTNGGVTIQDLRFDIATASGATSVPVTSVTVKGSVAGGVDVTAPVIGTSTLVSGVNIVVPTGFGGVNIPVTVNYATVGIGGIVSNQTAQAKLVYAKYISGGTTTNLNVTSVNSNTMTVVGSKPTVTFNAPTPVSSLTIGNQPIASVTVAADAAGDIKVNAIPLTLSGSGGVYVASGTSPTVYINGTQYTSISTAGFVGGSGTTVLSSTTFTNGYTVPAGQSVTFVFYATVTGTLGNAGTSAITASLPQSTFLWTDVNGNMPSITGTSILNYPATTVQVHN